MESQARNRVLLTGATGYVGGRLRRLLEARGVPLRCLVRRPERLAGSVVETTELVRGDVLERQDLERAMEGIRAAYYLVHSMGGPHDFMEKDRQAAEAFAAAAKNAGVGRVIYLGGLGKGPDLSAHLASRHEVGALQVERVVTARRAQVSHSLLALEGVGAVGSVLPHSGEGEQVWNL